MENQIYIATKSDLEQLIDNAISKALSNINFNNNKKVLDIMNVEEASEFLNLAIATIYDKTSKGILPHKKKGNKLYFLRNELEAWILDGNIKTNKEIEEEAMDYILNNPNK